jgi:hypothetical protein
MNSFCFSPRILPIYFLRSNCTERDRLLFTSIPLKGENLQVYTHFTCKFSAFFFTMLVMMHLIKQQIGYIC